MKKNLTTPSRTPAKRKQGFLSRMHSRTGRALLARRRRKGRKRLTI